MWQRRKCSHSLSLGMDSKAHLGMDSKAQLGMDSKALGMDSKAQALGMESKGQALGMDSKGQALDVGSKAQALGMNLKALGMDSKAQLGMDSKACLKSMNAAYSRDVLACSFWAASFKCLNMKGGCSVLLQGKKPNWKSEILLC